MERIREGLPGGNRHIARGPGTRGCQGNHDHRPLPEGSGSAGQRRRNRHHHRRHGQGFGHDRADDGDDARLRHHRRGGAAAAAASGRSRTWSNDTFNAITVDGECSTNDCVMILANGASGVTIDEASYGTFADALRAVCLPLAIGIVRGGEGATKLVTVNVTGRSDAGRSATLRKGDREFAAGEDGHPRRRPELGPADCRGRARRCCVRTGPGGGDYRADRAVQERPAV